MTALFLGPVTPKQHFFTPCWSYFEIYLRDVVFCLGGQCPDPGYPASGQLIGHSFLEGSKVTFACDDEGYSLLFCF